MSTENIQNSISLEKFLVSQEKKSFTELSENLKQTRQSAQSGDVVKYNMLKSKFSLLGKNLTESDRKIVETWVTSQGYTGEF
jgi:hypothetical protein